MAERTRTARRGEEILVFDLSGFEQFYVFLVVESLDVSVEINLRCVGEYTQRAWKAFRFWGRKIQNKNLATIR